MVAVVQALSRSAAYGIFPDQGLNPHLALARGFFTTELPGKSPKMPLFNVCVPHRGRDLCPLGQT